MIKYLTDEKDFFRIIGKKEFIVSFYADWCGRCQLMSDLLKQITTIDVLKINIDIFPELAKCYGIMSIPTTCFFKDGTLLFKKIGLCTLDELNKLIQDI